MALVAQGIAGWPVQDMAVCGSSLGGFYATAVAERVGCPAVVINPAVDPARDLAAHIGEQTAWHDPAERFYFEPAYVDELRALEDGIAAMAADPARPRGRQFAVIAQGDELLDWREMQAFCAGGEIRLLPGSDHALSDFDHHIDAVFEHLNLAR